MSDQATRQGPGDGPAVRTISLSRRHLDGLGLVSLLLAAVFLAGATWVEQPMGMGVLMGLFIAALAGAVAAFVLARRPAAPPSESASRRPLEAD